MPDREFYSNDLNRDSGRENHVTSDADSASDDRSVDVSNLSTNRKQNPEIASRGRGPIIINDPEATMLNRGIFDNSNQEYFDGDLYR